MDSNSLFRVFAYDSSTDPSTLGVSTTLFRDYHRRRRSCGRFNIKTGQVCPEPDQMLLMRQDGEWFSKNTQSSKTWAIVNKVGTKGEVVEESGIKYSCEEFPAASWIEGGDGPNGNTPAFKRCVPYICRGCPRGTKADQTWQSTAHAHLAATLAKSVRCRRKLGQQRKHSLFQVHDG